MPGTNAGTGRPMWFRCAKCRRERRRGGGALQVQLTGRERPKNDGNAGYRSDTVEREYRCPCGHVGWSRHTDLRNRGRR